MRQEQIRWGVAIVVLFVQITITYGNANNHTDTKDDGFSDTWDLLPRGKKKKEKYLMALLMGIVLVKSIIIPLALKAMAIVSGKAIMLSALSLILASIVGFKKVAHGWDRVGQAPLKDRGDAYAPYPYHTGPMDTYENTQTWSRQFKS